jgi:hypothetical protein
MAFAEYPKAMRHPQYRPAVLSKDTIDPNTKQTIKAPPGSPVRFPDVFVHNEDQEKQYAALGYLPNGVSDPDSYHRAMTGNDEPSDHKHHEYPRWMYQADEDGEVAVTMNHEVIRVRGVLVKNEKEREALRGDWYEMPAEAAEAAVTEEDAEETTGESGDPATPKNRGGRPRKEAV